MMKQRQDLDHTYIGSHFDRQVRIHGWDQKLLENQTVFIMGVGGLGSVVMIALLRLGVKKIIIIDYDVVDNHNMNRQLMYSIKDIGKNKVDCAIKNADFHNIGGTIIQGFHGNALTHWKKIIQYTRQCDVVFNCIDYGDKFDVAVTSLCLKLKKPLIMGGTFATSLTVDYFGAQGLPCFLCTNDEAARQKDIVQKISPDKITQYDDISFLPKNNNPIGRSSTIVCTICGQFMVSQYINYLFLADTKPMKPIRLIAYHNTAEIVTFQLESNKKCLFCGDPNYVEPIVHQPTIISEGVQVETKQLVVDSKLQENHQLQKAVNFNCY